MNANKFQEGLDAKLALKQKRIDERTEANKKPTPGPWIVREATGAGSRRADGTKHFHIYVQSSLGLYPIALDLTEGDARLMAQSHNLLAIARAYVEMGETVQTLEADANPVLREALDFARKTIANVEGRAS